MKFHFFFRIFFYCNFFLLFRPIMLNLILKIQMLAHLIRYRHIMGNIRLLIFIYTHGTSHRGRQKGLNLPEKLKTGTQILHLFSCFESTFPRKVLWQPPLFPHSQTCVHLWISNILNTKMNKSTFAYSKLSKLIRD